MGGEVKKTVLIISQNRRAIRLELSSSAPSYIALLLVSDCVCRRFSAFYRVLLTAHVLLVVNKCHVEFFIYLLSHASSARVY